jgi:hypothetical protein
MHVVHSAPASDVCPTCGQRDQVLPWRDSFHCGRCNQVYRGTGPARVAAAERPKLRLLHGGADPGE